LVQEFRNGWEHLRRLRLNIFCGRGHQKPRSSLIPVERVFIQITVKRKGLLNPVHSFFLWKIERLLATEIVDGQLQINGRSNIVFAYLSSNTKAKLRSELLR
jgi:hypothetical protein